MISALIGWLGGPIFGSVIGGGFGLLNRWMDTKSKALDIAEEDKKRAHELVVKDKDLAYMQAEAISKKDIAVTEGLSREEVARFDAVAKSHEADALTESALNAAGPWRWLLVLIEAIRKATRPLLTWAVAGSMIYLSLRYAMKIDQVTGPDQNLLIKEAFNWIAGQASMILGYWFVGRGTPK
jgi:hypothetical protein